MQRHVLGGGSNPGLDTSDLQNFERRKRKPLRLTLAVAIKFCGFVTDNLKPGDQMDHRWASINRIISMFIPRSMVLGSTARNGFPNGWRHHVCAWSDDYGCTPASP